jgi:thiamine-phosphate pyrophosphorylase
MKHLRKNNLRLCFVTNIKDRHIGDYLTLIKQAIRGGVTMVQLREKAIALQRLLKPIDVPLIINDFVDLAAEINADGVHIGQQDMSASQARPPKHGTQSI